MSDAIIDVNGVETVVITCFSCNTGVAHWNGFSQAFRYTDYAGDFFHVVGAGAIAISAKGLGASAHGATVGLGKVFGVFGGAMVIGEQSVEVAEKIDEGGPAGVTILGGTANSTLIIGTSIGADALIGAGTGSLFPGAGTVVGAIGGAGVGALVSFGLPSPSVTGQDIMQGYYTAAQAEQFNEQNGIPMYGPF
ncbi:MAG: hypothetical protein WBQ17_11110 [Rhizomicrobium sp.]